MDAVALANWFAEQLPWTGQGLGPITELAGGWESDVHRLSLSHDSGIEDLVIRLYVGADGPEKARREFAGMRLLHEAGYPVPRVIGHEPDPGTLGRPFLVMEWVPNAVDRGWPDAMSPDQIGDFVQLLVDLHALAWRPFADPADHDDLVAGRATERLIAGVRHLDIAPMTPGFDRVLRWLENNIPPSTVGPAVVHWDFHVGNILVADDGTSHVVDWTQIAATDPRFDVAWTRLLIAMAVDSDAADSFLAEYERRSTELPDMQYYDIAAAFKRLYSVAVSLDLGPEELGMRAEAATHMRADLATLEVPYRIVRDGTGLAIEEVNALLNP